MARLDLQVVRWMKKVEKVLVRLVVLGMLALVILQLALARATDPVNFYLTFAQKIEAPVNESEVNWQPNLVFSVSGGSGAGLHILVNDQDAGNLANGSLELKVEPGDKLAVDARRIAFKGIKLKVTGVGSEFTYPKLNQTWMIRGSIVDLGEVK